MTRKMFENFLEDVVQYAACERYWEQLVQEIAESLGQTGEWQQWIPRQSPNGTPYEKDGNPIYDGRSERLDRAFRIIQHSAFSDEVEIVAWLKSYEEFEYRDVPGNELVIRLSLSQESAQLARALLYKWMTPDTTQSDMSSFIDVMLPRMSCPETEEPDAPSI
jgi:hypothetical protein